MSKELVKRPVTTCIPPEIIKRIEHELLLGNRKYGWFKSMYEALGASRLEYKEFEEAIQNKDDANIREEAAQVAAMMIKTLMLYDL